MRRFLFTSLTGTLACLAIPPGVAAQAVPQRVPWTTSRIMGSPEPPPPFRAERLFPELSFRQPVEMIPGPVEGASGDSAGGTQPSQSVRAYVVERGGRVLSFRTDVASPAPDVHVVLDGARQIPGLKAIYGLAFHPRFAENRCCYLCYILEDGRPDGTRVSRFRLTTDDPPIIDPASETILLTFLSGGHNGGSLKFGHDGCLYISTGDGAGPDPPDGLDTGQDVSDLLGAVLRIDVDRAEGDRPYAIPPDNPFVGVAGARPELWAYGFRNPWRMSFDRATGDLWLGDVGWQRFEMVYRVERGGNYGWSVMEGPQLVRTEARRGPTPILPPTHVLDRADAASVTGGFVYHGSKHPELQGCYIFGDWVTGKIWALRHDGARVVSHRELADTRRAIICFYEAPDGELALLDYNAGTIHQLVPHEATPESAAAFPRLLSETGLFTSTADHQPAPGVLPFSINAPRWMDGAVAERFVAFPHNGTLKFARRRGPRPRGVVNPEHGVLVKTISLETRPGDPASRRRIETQILYFSGLDWQNNGGEWFGYTYLWNEEQTDAALVSAAGMEFPITVADPAAPGGERTLLWRVHSRSECYTCHNPWAGYRLAFTEPQLDRLHDYGGGPVDQLQALEQMGVVELAESRSPSAGKGGNGGDAPDAAVVLVDPADEHQPLERRARSYLHVNCAHCHRVGGGGTSLMQLDAGVPLEQARLLGERPSQGTFQLPSPALVRPGEPFASVLYYRMAKTGRGRMPHIGSAEVDWHGLSLIHDWIRSLPAGVDGRPDSSGEARRQSHVSSPPLPSDPAAANLEEWLANPVLALALQRTLAADPGRLNNPRWQEFLQRAGRHSDPIIRDLFETFLPASERVQRLGSRVDPQAILSLSGEPERGRALFWESQALACRNCHRVGEQGTPIGPDLTTIGRLRSREQLLESILDPSRTIEPKYLTYLVETTAGEVHAGLLAAQEAAHVTLRTADNKMLEIPAAAIERLAPQQRSLMPDLLYRDLTAEQLADLLAYLSSLQ